MQTKKLTAALCAAIMLFALMLAGCDTAPADNADGTATSSSTTASTTATTTTATTTTIPIDFPSWDAVTTTVTTTATATQKPSAALATDLLGYIQNPDGTCTDKQSGVVFVDDSFSALPAAAVGLSHETASPEAFWNDGGRLVISADAAESHLTYHLAGGITEALVQLYAAVDSAVGEEVTVSASADGKSFTAVSFTSHEPIKTKDGYACRTYHFQKLPADTRYLKITCHRDTGVQLGRVRVNDLYGYYYPTHRLEARAAATFYVDAQNGNDENDGTTPATAFKTLAKAASRYFVPGDKLLIKRGGTYEGGITLQGVGLPAQRLYVGAYGEGANPVIVGGGNNALTVRMDYVTVENLEITNPNGQRGLAVFEAHAGANKGIVIRNCYVHDVNHNHSTFGYASGGIYLSTDGGTAAPTWFEDISVSQNTVSDVARCAIHFSAPWVSRPGWAYGCSKAFYKDDDNGWWPHTNVNISNNVAHNAQGDAILVIGGRNVLIERNFVSNAFCIEDEAMMRVKKESKGNIAAAALWTVVCNDVVIQHNEVSHTQLPAEGLDGEGYDIDISQKNVLLQYNFSHNNAGGFLLICDVSDFHEDAAKTTHTVRYNLSVNDKSSAFMVTNTVAKLDVYNNTIILSGYITLFNPFGDIKNYYFRNNIFHGKKAGILYAASSADFENIVFDNNIYSGGGEVPTVALLGRKERPLEQYGYIVTNTNRAAEISFAGSTPPLTLGVTARDAAIAAFTPKIPVDGAYATPAEVDINGDKITAPFYGCIIPKS